MKTGNTTNGALLCSLVQTVRVVIVRVILAGVLCVIVDVFIGHDEVLVIHVAFFIVIFCIWRCTLYRREDERGKTRPENRREDKTRRKGR